MSAGIKVDFFEVWKSSPVATVLQWGQTTNKWFLQLPHAPGNGGGFGGSLWPLRHHSRGVGPIFKLRFVFQASLEMISFHSAPGITKAWFCFQQTEWWCTHGDRGCECLTFHPETSQSNFPGSWDVDNLAQQSGLHIILKRFLFPGLNSDPNRQLSQINTIPRSSAWIRHPTNYLLEYKEC